MSKLKLKVENSYIKLLLNVKKYNESYFETAYLCPNVNKGPS
jgi:hypothetical protein